MERCAESRESETRAGAERVQTLYQTEGERGSRHGLPRSPCQEPPPPSAAVAVPSERVIMRVMVLTF